MHMSGIYSKVSGLSASTPGMAPTTPAGENDAQQNEVDMKLEAESSYMERPCQLGNTCIQ